MTDRELIELVEQSPPEDLTVEQISLLRQRLEESPEFRRALAEHVEIAQFMGAEPGCDNVSDEGIVNAARSHRSTVAMPRWGWALCLLVGAVLASALVVATIWPGGDDSHGGLADGRKPNQQDIEDEDSLEDRSDPAAEPSEPDEPAPANPPRDNDPADGEPPERPPASAEDKPSSPQKPDAIPPEQPRPEQEPVGEPTPWAKTLAADPVPFDRAWATAAYPGAGEGVARDDLSAWFEPAPGGRNRDCRFGKRRLPITPRDRGRPNEMATIGGMARLRAPWGPDHALRLALYQMRRFSFHFWNGRRGVSLFRYDDRSAWAAYRTTRSGIAAKPESFELVATDGGRDQRMNPHGGYLEFRCRDGRLCFSRGDVPIIIAPFEGLPTDVILQGECAIHHIEMVRSPGLPKAEKPLPIVSNIDRLSEHAWLQHIPQGATFEKLDGGAVRLRSENSKEVGWLCTPFPADTPHEAIFQLADAQVGTGVYFGDAEGKPRFRLAFVRDRRNKKQMIVEPRIDGDFHPVARSHTQMVQRARHPVAFVGPAPWLKLSIAGGYFRCWLSSDGRHWARASIPLFHGQPCTCTTVGIFCAPDRERRGVTLRRLQFRRFDALARLVTNDLIGKAKDYPAKQSGSLSRWLAAVDGDRPPRAGVLAWRRACAMRTLSGVPPRQLVRQLNTWLIGEAFPSDWPRAGQLRLLDQLACISDAWNDAPQAQQLIDRYFDLARQAHRQGEHRPYTAVAARWLTMPLETATLVRWPDRHADVPRTELFEHAYAGRWEEALRLSRRLKYWEQAPPMPAVDWIQALAKRRLWTGDSQPLLSDWRHPLLAEVGKGAFNVMAEIESALRDESYKTACQIISSAGYQSGLGLLADSNDPQLMTSLPVAIRIAMREHPRIRTTMQKEFGQLGELRVQRMIRDREAAGIKAAAIQFRGTEAADSALRWLGDQALSRGDFSAAEYYYRQAEPGTSGDDRRDLRARLRLAASMTGRDVGQPVAGPVRLHQVTMGAEAFEEMVREMRRTHAGSQAEAGDSVWRRAPEPSAFRLDPRGTVDGNHGNEPTKPPSGIDPLRFDWHAEQWAAALVDNMLYVSNRFQVSAFDLDDGQRKWQVSLGSESGRARDWALAPMRPLVAGQRIYVRRLGRLGPQLVCLDRAGGEVLWGTELERDVASDPLLRDGKLVAVTVGRNDRQLPLYLTRFDPRSGKTVSDRHLTNLRPSWRGRPVCEVSSAGEQFVIELGSAVLCTTSEGDIRWLRRHLCLPAGVDSAAARQSHGRPLIVGSHAILAPRGVLAVKSVRIDTGRLQWKRVLPTVRRLVGRLGDNLLVQTDGGYRALAVATGEPKWHHPVDDPLAAVSWGGPGGFLFAEKVPVEKPGGPERIRLTWLDPENGRVRGTTTLEKPENRHLCLGPLVACNGQLWGFVGEGQRKHDRRLFRMSPHGKADPPRRIEERADQTVMKPD